MFQFLLHRRPSGRRTKPPPCSCACGLLLRSHSAAAPPRLQIRKKKTKTHTQEGLPVSCSLELSGPSFLFPVSQDPGCPEPWGAAESAVHSGRLPEGGGERRLHKAEPTFSGRGTNKETQAARPQLSTSPGGPLRDPTPAGRPCGLNQDRLGLQRAPLCWCWSEGLREKSPKPNRFPR